MHFREKKTDRHLCGRHDSHRYVKMGKVREFENNNSRPWKTFDFKNLYINPESLAFWVFDAVDYDKRQATLTLIKETKHWSDLRIWTNINGK